ncbi:HNH endonuclease [Paenarthrobacter ureafaciens]|uniref:HNH endonuclease n=1 Tax=Paenarthrobacter ureafaciens TaxID=37931 RepID=UPI003CEAAD04
MADDGLIDRTDLRVWKLTDTGKTEARLQTPASWIETDETMSTAAPSTRLPANPRISTREGDVAIERSRREGLWASLLAAGGPAEVPRSVVRDLKIYGGQPGIFVPNAETRTQANPKGIALSFLHTGRHYDDELTSTGVIYHYPQTKRTGHDKSEIEASHAAYRAGLPVFVIGPGNKSTTRTVYRGYIEDIDDKNKVLLITFTPAELPPPPTPSELNEAFLLTDNSATTGSFSARRNRPNQMRFAFDVFKRYGTECAVCGLTIGGLLQAAHLLSKSAGGSDDARNGLPLCANHHLAFDRGYWCIDTDLKLHAQSNGPGLFDLAIPRNDLSHLPRQPHPQAISRVWTDWQAKFSQG